MKPFPQNYTSVGFTESMESFQFNFPEYQFVQRRGNKTDYPLIKRKGISDCADCYSLLYPLKTERIRDKLVTVRRSTNSIQIFNNWTVFLLKTIISKINFYFAILDLIFCLLGPEDFFKGQYIHILFYEKDSSDFTDKL